MPPLALTDFSGGLNLRDSPNELALNETPDATNFTLDQRGAMKLRKGCINSVALPGATGTVADIFYSEALDLWLCARESTTYRLFTRPGDLSGAWTDRGQISSSVSARATFADWPGTTSFCLIATSIADATNGGVYTLDATPTLTKRSAVPGTAIAVWANKAWVISTTTPTRLSRCAAGDPTTWGDFTDLRDKDASPLTALGVAAGSLLAFKRRSAYRVNDASTGAYSTIDSASGCVGPLAVVAVRGRLYTWGSESLYEWDGIGPGKRVGDKVWPLFALDAVIGGIKGKAICAGLVEDRAVFAYPATAAGNAGNDRLLEYDPEHRWVMRHQLPSSGQDEISSLATKGADLYAALKDGDDLFKMFSTTPGADDGTLYAANYRTPWLQPNRGRLARILRAQVEGLLLTGGTNTLTVRVYKDWDLSAFDSYDVSTDLRGGDANDQQETTILRSLGHSRAFALEFVTGTAAGDAAVRSLDLETVALER